MRDIIRELIETIILSLLLFIGIQFAVQTYQVRGASMHPTLSQGQYLLVNKLAYRHVNVAEITEDVASSGDYAGEANFFPFHPPKHGEVVIFNFPDDPSRDFVKRVIGIPGDTVEIRDGDTYINGVRQDEPYIERRDDYDDMEAFKVPPNSFFVLGDNRLQSNDSRDWGTVPLDNIVGKAWVRYWPPHQIRIFSTGFAMGYTAAEGAQ